MTTIPDTKATPATEAETVSRTHEHRPPSNALLAFFFIGSGFSAVAYQVILSRYTQLIVGSTAHSISALLVAFMMGLSIGSGVGGRLADRSIHPLRIYAIAEGLIGLYALVFPLLFPAYQQFYLRIAPPVGEDLVIRNLIRFLLGVAAFLLPSVLMGVTTPAFAKAVAAHRRDSGRWLARLYGWNTLGAALGAFASAYVLVPHFGLIGGMTIASVLNFTVAILAYVRSTPLLASGRTSPSEVSNLDDPGPSRTDPSALQTLRLETLRELADLPVKPGSIHKAMSLVKPILQDLRRDNLARPALHPTVTVFLLFAFSSGFLSFTLEILWTHVLAILLGNSVYAFGLMLGSLLLGLAAGTVIARRLAGSWSRALTGIGVSLAFAGFWVLVTLEIWDHIPTVFLLFADSSPSFFLMECVRFSVAFLLMFLPTASFGVSFPLILHCAASRESGFGRRVGYIYAANTIGAVLGALAGSYVILPGLGSLDGLRLSGAGLLVVGGLGILLISSLKRRKILAVIACTAIFWVWLVPVNWDFNSLNMAAAIYLGDSASQEGQIIYQREDATGGLTSVLETNGVRTLLTNGKFQGDNSEEVPIQHRLANIPTLFTKERERAFVIGLGTGATLASIAAHGFKEVVCAEISLPIIEAAKLHFQDVNGGVLDWPGVVIIPEDGRSVLFERPTRYDVISIEVNSIWFAGMGAIYSKEFYQLASKRLRRNGVLLQWFPIHHLSAKNLYLVVNTVRSVFPYVSVWTHRHQGFVVASNEPLQIDLDSIRADLERPELQPYFHELASGSPLEFLSDLVVTDRQVDRFLDSMARLLRTDRSLLSTDTWPVLEYETPKDILENFSYFQNRAIFRRFREPRPFPFRGDPTEGERNLAEAAHSLGWQDPRAVPRLARLWAEHPDYSSAASAWLLDELVGRDVIADFPSNSHSALWGGVADIGSVASSALAKAECKPFPRFVSRVDRVPLRIGTFSGENLDGTVPEAALDDVLVPQLGTGWRIRPFGSSPRIDLLFQDPLRVGVVSLVVEPVDGSFVRTRLFGQDGSGRWRPLASGSGHDEIVCRTVRTYTLDTRLPKLTGIRIEMQGEALSHRITLHEAWVFETGVAGEHP